MDIDALKIVRENFKMGYVLTFAEAMLIQQAIDYAIQPGNSPAIPDGSVAMLQRWLIFGRAMQEAGSSLPRNLIAETEQLIAAAPQPPVSASGWIKCSDRKPPQRNYISAVSHHGEYVSGIVNGEWIDLHDGSTFAIADIYLWLLLPEITAAPKPEGE